MECAEVFVSHTRSLLINAIYQIKLKEYINKPLLYDDVQEVL